MKLDFLLSAVTKIPLGRVLLVAVSLIVSQATATTNPVSITAFDVRFQVTLFEAKSGEALKDYSEVVVWLVPVRAFQTASLNAERPHYRMTQHNKMFEPHLLVVPMGSIVEFRNRDPWFHDAFSLSDSKRFDLGSHLAGAQKTLRFNRAGVAYVFCNIHPQMGAVVLAVESPYFGVSDRTGHISISNVPPGTYSLHVWYENGAWQAPKTLHRAIVLGDGHRSTATISIALAKLVPINAETSHPTDLLDQGE
jgi:plastocyanin